MPGISLQSLIILSQAGAGDFSDQNKQNWHGLVQRGGWGACKDIIGHLEADSHQCPEPIVVSELCFVREPESSGVLMWTGLGPATDKILTRKSFEE